MIFGVFFEQIWAPKFHEISKIREGRAQDLAKLYISSHTISVLNFSQIGKPRVATNIRLTWNDSYVITGFSFKLLKYFHKELISWKIQDEKFFHILVIWQTEVFSDPFSNSQGSITFLFKNKRSWNIQNREMSLRAEGRLFPYLLHQ